MIIFNFKLIKNINYNNLNAIEFLWFGGLTLALPEPRHRQRRLST